MPRPSMIGETLVIPAEQDDPGAQLPLTWFFLGLLACVLIIVSIATLLQGWRGIHWRMLISHFILLTFILLVVLGALWLMMSILDPSHIQVETTPRPTPLPSPMVPLEPTPTGLLWVVGVSLAAVLLLLILWMLRASPKARQSVQSVALEIQRAHHALLAGGSLQEIILSCYHEMSLSLEEQQGILRKSFMTAEEFEGLLEAQGYPHEPVHQLTQLFEAVRYGIWQPAPGDEQKAIACLETILAYSAGQDRTAGGSNSTA